MSDASQPIVHIIDDDASLRLALSRLLSASGYHVQVYESAMQFLAEPPAFEQGCILLDVNMPELTGLQLHEHLLKLHNTLPVIFLTGNGNISMGVNAMKAGAEDFLTKPVEKDGLLEAIQRAVARCQTAYTQNAHLFDLRKKILLLTPRELEVFKLIILGMLNKQVAYALGNTERTVKAHRRSIMEKMEVNSLAELVLIASELGMLDAKKEGAVDLS